MCVFGYVNMVQLKCLWHCSDGTDRQTCTQTDIVEGIINKSIHLIKCRFGLCLLVLLVIHWRRHRHCLKITVKKKGDLLKVNTCPQGYRISIIRGVLFCLNVHITLFSCVIDKDDKTGGTCKTTNTLDDHQNVFSQLFGNIKILV